MTELTQAYLKEIFDYHPDGYLVWKNSRPKVKAGSIAGCFDKSNGYIKIGLDKKRYFAHRLIWFWHHGKWPDDVIDHKERIRHINKIELLRDATQAQNSFNKGKSKLNKSGYIGVSFYRPTQKWMACICKDSKSIYLGYFTCKIEAAKAYDEAARKYFGEFAKTNFSK